MSRYDRLEEVEKGIDTIEEVKKFNPYHGKDGRFASKGGGGAGGGATKEALGELNGLPKKRGMSKVSYDEIKTYEKVLAKFPVGTKLSHEIEAGTEIYEKISDSEFGISWKQIRAPWNDEVKRTAFDVAHWMAGSGVISRGDIKEIEP